MSILNTQCDIVWTTDHAQEAQGGIFLGSDTNNFAAIVSRGGGGVLRLRVTVGGVSQYSFNTAQTDGVDVKIEFDTVAHQVKFYYYSAGWVQLGSTQSDDIGDPCYVFLTSEDAASFAGANPIAIDDLYLSVGAYSTSAPTAGIVMEDDFTGGTIDTAKWDETDPNGRISQSNVLNLANPHSATRAWFTDFLQSDEAAEAVSEESNMFLAM